MSVVGIVFFCKKFLKGGDQRLKKVLKVGTKSKKLVPTPPVRKEKREKKFHLFLDFKKK